MIYLLLRNGDIIACFRDPQETEEFLAMIKEICRRFYQELHSLHYMAKPAITKKVWDKYAQEIMKLITKHLPTHVQEDSKQISTTILDESDANYTIVEVPLISMHQLTENTIRIKING